MRNVHSSPCGSTAALHRPPPSTSCIIEPEVVSLPGTRILVVDDDDVYRGLYEAVLSLAGYETLSVSNGDEALTALYAGDFDLIVADNNKPFLDGWQLIRDLRTSGCKVPVMLIGVPLQDSDSFTEDIRRDVTTLLQKPARMCDLLSCVAYSLGAGESKFLENHTL